MDTKRMLTGMILAMMVILGYKMFIEWLWKKNNWKDPYQAATTQHVTPATGQSSTTSSTGDSTTTAPSTVASGSTVAPAPITGMRAIGGESAGSVTIGSTLSK